MSEEQLDRVHELKELLTVQLWALVGATLREEDPEVRELVIEDLHNEFRFWNCK